MNEDKKWCCFHPREIVVGVCALCLNERLLVVAASKQQSNLGRSLTVPKRVLPKIFALTSLLKQHKSHDRQLFDTNSSTCSQEDSFISIKFEENGVASWDKEKTSKMSHDKQCDEVAYKSVIEHAKPRTALRWRRGIGHLFQVIKWKRSTSKGHVATKVEGGPKVNKYGWIRSLTKKKRSKEASFV